MDRKSWREWTDTQLITRFENGDLDYSQAQAKDMSKMISAAYETTKPELEVLLPAAIAKVAKFIVSANEKIIGPGFWVPRYVYRTSNILSVEETLVTPDSTNGSPQCKDHLESSALKENQEEKIKNVQDDQKASPAPARLTRKRPLSRAGLNGEAHKSQEDTTENEASLPVEKRQRME